MRYDSEHKSQTREKVLKVAAKAIRAEGPRGVGVATIMSKAGLTHGGFYAHFESKDDLIAAAIEKMFVDYPHLGSWAIRAMSVSPVPMEGNGFPPSSRSGGG